MSDFAAHWSERLMPEMRRQAWLAAYRIVTAPEDDLSWETFNTGIADLEREAHRLGASHMPDEYQAELHRELTRELVDGIHAVLGPWREAQLCAGIVAADIKHWDARVREWALLAAPSCPCGLYRECQPGCEHGILPTLSITRAQVDRNIVGDSGDNVPVGRDP